MHRHRRPRAGRDAHTPCPCESCWRGDGRAGWSHWRQARSSVLALRRSISGRRRSWHFRSLVWLIDGSAAGRYGSLVAAAAAGWWFGFGYFLAGLYWIGYAFLVDAATFGWLMPFAVTALPAGLALFTALGLRAGAAALDARRGTRAGARRRAHRRGVAARPCAHRFSVERLRLRAGDALGARAGRRAHGPLGPHLRGRRGLCVAGRARRRSCRHRGGRWMPPALSVVVLAAMAIYGAHAARMRRRRPMSKACGFASCSPICSRMRNSTIPRSRRARPLPRALGPRHRAAGDRRARRDAPDLAGIGVPVLPHARARRARADRRPAAGRDRADHRRGARARDDADRQRSRAPTIRST